MMRPFFVDQNRAARAVLSQALLNDAAAALGTSVGVAIVGDQVGKNADFLCDRLHTPPPFISRPRARAASGFFCPKP
jgi:hypothetical protein